MPTYEYICTKCGEQFDMVQSIMDKPLMVCPKEKCSRKRWGKGKVKKLISAGAGLLFKGSGFYITDYRSENYKKGASKDTPASTNAGADSKSSTGDGKSSSGDSKSSSGDTKSSSGNSSSTSKKSPDSQASSAAKSS